MNAATIRTVSAAIAFCACSVEAPTWCVPDDARAPHDVVLEGDRSRPTAPARRRRARREFPCSAIAASGRPLHVSPRLVLTKKAPGRIASKNAPPRSPRVSFVRARWTADDVAIPRRDPAGSRPARPRAAPRRRRRASGSTPTTFIPKAMPRAATSRPIAPRPAIPSVRPAEPLRLAVLGLVPDAGAEVGRLLGNPPVEREDEPPRELGDRDGVLPGAVRDGDRPGRGRREVDRVDAGARADDQGEARCPFRSPSPSPSSTGRRGPPARVSRRRRASASPSSFGS